MTRPADSETVRPIHGSQIQTFSGDYAWPLNPHKWTPRIEDIAHALSKLCRFTGHTKGDGVYSVAQHSCHVSDLVIHDHPELGLAALLHDGSEAYLGDLSTPLKAHPAFGEAYREAERALQRKIYRTFGCSADEDPVVKQADLRLLATEKRDLLRPGPEWRLLRDIQPLNERIVPWPSSVAKREFLKRFKCYYALPVAA